MESQSRVCTPVSDGELERRWTALRGKMLEAGVDALVVQGASTAVGIGGSFRWLTGISPFGSYPQTVIFPSTGLMTLVCHGPFGGETTFDGRDPLLRGIGSRLTTSSFPSVEYTRFYDAELIAKRLDSGGFRSIGIASMGTTYFGFGERLRELLPTVMLVDAQDLIDPLRAVKSPEELECIRETARIQDEVLARVREFIKPGLRDFEVMAYAQYQGQLLGCEGGYYLASSAPAGEPALMRTRSQQGRQILTGDVYFFQAETAGPGGYFVHLGRPLALGKPPRDLIDAFNAAVEAQDYTLELLQPGASCSSIFREYNAYLRGRGLAEETRLHCHGQGYDVVERPLVRHDESLTVQEGMNIGIHPSFTTKSMFATVCDNFLVGPNGHIERLHASPREILTV